VTPPDRQGVIKRSVAIARHRTSVSLEQPFWDALNAIAREQGRSLSSLIGEIDGRRGACNLSSALRVFVLAAVQAGTDAERPAAIACEDQPPGRPGS
jgi:predicted DNA-binding ribbon-helix-helix protein